MKKKKLSERKRKSTLTGRCEARVNKIKISCCVQHLYTSKKKLVSPTDDTPSVVDPHFIGELSQKCPHCGALFFEGEKNSSGKYSLCCYNG